MSVSVLSLYHNLWIPAYLIDVYEVRHFEIVNIYYFIFIFTLLTEKLNESKM